MDSSIMILDDGAVGFLGHQEVAGEGYRMGTSPRGETKQKNKWRGAGLLDSTLVSHDV